MLLLIFAMGCDSVSSERTPKYPTYFRSLLGRWEIKEYKVWVKDTLNLLLESARKRNSSGGETFASVKFVTK